MTIKEFMNKDKVYIVHTTQDEYPILSEAYHLWTTEEIEDHDGLMLVSRGILNDNLIMYTNRTDDEIVTCAFEYLQSQDQEDDSFLLVKKEKNKTPQDTAAEAFSINHPLLYDLKRVFVLAL